MLYFCLKCPRIQSPGSIFQKFSWVIMPPHKVPSSIAPPDFSSFCYLWRMALSYIIKYHLESSWWWLTKHWSTQNWKHYRCSIDKMYNIIPIYWCSPYLTDSTNKLFWPEQLDGKAKQSWSLDSRFNVFKILCGQSFSLFIMAKILRKQHKKTSSIQYWKFCEYLKIHDNENFVVLAKSMRAETGIHNNQLCLA